MNCKICNQEYTPTRKDNIYCSQRCKFEAKKKQRTLKHKKNCENCAISFETFDKQKRFCSQKCFGLAYSLKCSIKFNCEYCNKENIIKGSRNGQRFCNKKCRLLKEPISSTIEVREKISKSREKYIGENHPMFGKHQTEEAKEKISKHHIESGCFSGENNPMYGKHHTIETKEKMSQIIATKILNKERKPHSRGTKMIFKKYSKEIYARSTWEKLFIELIDKDDNIISAEYENVKITYFYDQFRNYFPDLLLNFKDGKRKIIEIKPSCYLEAKISQAKFQAAREYCKNNNMIFEVWTEKDNPYGILNEKI